MYIFPENLYHTRQILLDVQVKTYHQSQVLTVVKQTNKQTTTKQKKNLPSGENILSERSKFYVVLLYMFFYEWSHG